MFSALRNRYSRVAVERRSVLLGSAALVLAPASAFLGENPASAEEPDANADFQFVSHFLTGHAQLDPALASRIVLVSTAQDTNFLLKVSQLRQFIEGGTLLPAGLQAALDAAASPVATLPRQIVRAWYVGVVGGGDEAVCITYTGALMHVAVADTLQPPSYAHGQYGSWASKPV
jgi:hypothetical protein